MVEAKLGSGDLGLPQPLSRSFSQSSLDKLFPPGSVPPLFGTTLLAPEPVSEPLGKGRVRLRSLARTSRRRALVRRSSMTRPASKLRS